MATKQFLDLPGLQVYDENIKALIQQSITPIFYDTTANWNAKSSLVSTRGAIYVYSDYQTTSGEGWTCDPDYYFDAPFEADISIWWAYEGQLPITKDNNIPCIALGTNYVFSSGEGSGGIIFISKEIDGTEFTIHDVEYDREFTFKYDGEPLEDSEIPTMNVKISSGTYSYQGETWYYCTAGGGGSTPTDMTGVEYIPHLHEDWTENIPTTVGRIFDLVAPESGQNIPGIKVGDGNAYLIDMPFTDCLYKQHIEDTVSHITAAERTAWNNKVRCYMDTLDEERLIFTTN